MASAARADRFLRRVTAITIRMGLKAGRNGLASARWVMTGGALLGRFTIAVVVIGVVKNCIKSLDKVYRKGFDRRIFRFCIRMADGAHYLVFARRELIKMASDTGFMPGEIHL
jgi:hypothetical protein